MSHLPKKGSTKRAVQRDHSQTHRRTSSEPQASRLVTEQPGFREAPPSPRNPLPALGPTHLPWSQWPPLPPRRRLTQWTSCPWGWNASPHGRGASGHWASAWWSPSEGGQGWAQVTFSLPSSLACGQKTGNCVVTVGWRSRAGASPGSIPSTAVRSSPSPGGGQPPGPPDAHEHPRRIRAPLSCEAATTVTPTLGRRPRHREAADVDRVTQRGRGGTGVPASLDVLPHTPLLTL